MAERKRKFWGWGYEDQGPNPDQQRHIADRMAKRFGLDGFELTPPPKESELNLRAPQSRRPTRSPRSVPARPTIAHYTATAAAFAMSCGRSADIFRTPSM